MKKLSLILAAMIAMGTMTALTGCGGSTANEEPAATEATTVATTAKAEPTMSEDEARRRAVDAVQDEIDSISPYGIDWGSYDFNRFISDSCSCNFNEVEYIESSDVYKISTSNGSCGVSVSLYGVDCTAGSPFKLKFSAEVTVYSNGDTHVDSFKYDVVGA